jgi:hypothetical protein
MGSHSTADTLDCCCCCSTCCCSCLLLLLLVLSMRTLRSAVIVATHPGSIRMVLQAHETTGKQEVQSADHQPDAVLSANFTCSTIIVNDQCTGLNASTVHNRCACRVQ